MTMKSGLPGGPQSNLSRNNSKSSLGQGVQHSSNKLANKVVSEESDSFNEIMERDDDDDENDDSFD